MVKLSGIKSYPDGQPRRMLDISKAKEIGFQPRFSFDEGLRKDYRLV